MWPGHCSLRKGSLWSGFWKYSPGWSEAQWKWILAVAVVSYGVGCPQGSCWYYLLRYILLYSFQTVFLLLQYKLWVRAHGNLALCTSCAVYWGYYVPCDSLPALHMCTTSPILHSSTVLGSSPRRQGDMPMMHIKIGVTLHDHLMWPRTPDENMRTRKKVLLS